MQNELLSLQTKMQKTIVFITHDLDEALKIGDRIAIMKDGNIVQIGEPEEILNSPADAYVREFIQDVNRTKIVSASSIMRSSESIILEKAGVRTAAKKMKDLEIFALKSERFCRLHAENSKIRSSLRRKFKNFKFLP